jgi:hypothetical protein
MKLTTYALYKTNSPSSYLHAAKRTALSEALPEGNHDASPLDPENGFPQFYQNYRNTVSATSEYDEW